MTGKARKSKSHSPSRYLPAVAALLMIFFFSVDAEQTAAAMREGMRLCAASVIPTVLPSMVISGIFVAAGGGELLGRVLARPMRLLFGISGAGAGVILVGWLCGFPVGAASAAALKARGALTDDEQRRLMTFANIPGPAFVVSAVGVSMLGSLADGLALYSALILSASLIGFVSSFPRRNARSLPVPSALPSAAGISSAVTSSVTSAAAAMLTVCVYVVFFGTVTARLGEFAALCGLPPAVCAALCGFFEMTCGCSSLSALSRPAALPLIGLVLGWSGISVQLQLASVGKVGNPDEILVAKAVQGLLCFLFMLVRTFTA